VYSSRDGSANPTTQSFTFTRSSAPNAGSGSGTIKTGTLALDYGTTGQGYYETTAVDGVNGANSPYSQVVTWTTHPATGSALKFRAGNLAGITDAAFGGALSGFGIYGDNAYLKGKIVIASGSSGYANISDKPTIPTNTNQLTDGANLGGTAAWTGVSSKPGYIGAPAGDGLYIDGTKMGYYASSAWKTYIASNGDMILGDSGLTGNGLYWNQAAGTLNLKGAIYITNSIAAASVSGLAATATSSDFSAVTGATKPANNADVTANNTSYDTARVNGTAAATVQGGAARANAGLDSSGFLISKVIPGSAAAPSGAGLYLGSDYMGYYNSGWKSYIDNSGNCYFAGVGSFGTQTVSVDAMSQNIAIAGNDIWENSGANDGGSVRFNRIGLEGGATKYRDVAIYDGKGHKLAIFSGSIPGIYFGNPTDPINVDFDVTGSITVSGAVDFSTSPTIDFGSNHVVVTGTSDITCGASEGDMTTMSTSFTPKGDKILITFCASFYVSSANQTMWLIINVGGSNVRTMRSYIISGYQPHALTYIADVTPNSAVTVKMRWSGGTAIQQRGSTDGYRLMTITDLH
jgi:hypothetical protein